MKVTLIFPPQFEPTQPYSSLPCLTAKLRSKGIQTTQLDLNIESFHYLLSRDFLDKCSLILSGKVNKYEETSYIALRDQEDYIQSVKALASVKYVSSHIEACIKCIQSFDGFRDFNKYKESNRIIKLALQVISAAYFPSYIGLYETRLGHNHTSSEDAYNVALDADVNPYLEWFEEYVLDNRISAETNVVGMSIATQDQFIPALSLAYLIKKHHPSIYIVFGGLYITRTIEYINNKEKLFTFIDGAIIGEGETALYDLIQSIWSGNKVEDVNNLITYRNNKIYRGKIKQEQFASLPLPDFNGLPLDLYFSPVLILPYSTSRGCYYGKCTFCCHFHPIIEFREICPEKAVADIVELSTKYNTKYISFSDNSIQAKWLKEFSLRIKEKNVDISWFTFTRLEKEYTEETIEAIANGGGKLLMFGFESANDRILSLMDKGTSVKTVKEILINCSKHRLAIRLGMLVGFPGETLRESESTLNFLKENRSILDREFFAPPISRYKLLRDSLVYQYPEKFGVIVSTPLMDEDLEREQHYKVDQGMSMLEAEKQYQKFVEYFIKEFHSFKLMPDNKAHSFLYKCFSDKGELIYHPNGSIRHIKYIGPIKGLLQKKITLSSTTVTFASQFDLEVIFKNTEWIKSESLIRRLSQAKSIRTAKGELFSEHSNMTVKKCPKKYLFDIISQSAVEIDDIGNWIIQNIDFIFPFGQFQKKFFNAHGWTIEKDDLFDYIYELNDQDLISTE